MHDQRRMLTERLDRFVLDRLEPAIYRDVRPVTLTHWVVPGEPVPFAEAIGQAYAPFPVGARWGRPWGTTWFRARAEPPAALFGGDELPPDTSAELVVDLGSATDRVFRPRAWPTRPTG